MRSGPAPQSMEQAAAYVAEQVRGLPCAALAIIHGDHLLLTRGFGTAALGGGEAVTARTLFQVGAVTAAMTAAAVLHLHEQGLIDLDGPVQRYLPWFALADPAASARITVRHLLTHTSGIGAGAWKIGFHSRANRRSLLTAVRALRFIPPSAPPGARWQYSHMNYAALGLIVQVVSGRPYARYLQEEVLAPLGMERTTFQRPGAPVQGAAQMYRKRFGRLTPAVVSSDPWMEPAGLGLWSSAEDLAAFAAAQLGAKDAADCGFAWTSTAFHGSRLVFVSGMDLGHSAFVCFLPEQQVGLVLLCGTDGHDAERIGLNALRILQGGEPRVRPITPNLRKRLLWAAGAAGVAGIGLLAALALYAGRAVHPAAVVLLSMVVFFLWRVPGKVRRNPAVPLPVPLPVGAGGWGVEVALAWWLLLSGIAAWAIYGVARLIS